MILKIFIQQYSWGFQGGLSKLIWQFTNQIFKFGKLVLTKDDSVHNRFQFEAKSVVFLDYNFFVFQPTVFSILYQLQNGDQNGIQAKFRKCKSRTEGAQKLSCIYVLVQYRACSCNIYFRYILKLCHEGIALLRHWDITQLK